MKLILKKDVEKLGFTDDVVDVKNGYGRNYLIPRGYAVLATPSALKQRDEMLKQRAYKERKIVDEAKEKAAKVEGIEFAMTAKAQDSGKMFGSISAADVSKALAGKGVEIDAKYINILGGNIKRLGQYDAKLRFHRDVVTNLTFDVVAEA